jgi:hypothetical protein
MLKERVPSRRWPRERGLKDLAIAKVKDDDFAFVRNP